MSMRIAAGIIIAWFFVAVLADVLANEAPLVQGDGWQLGAPIAWSPGSIDKNVAPTSPPDATHWLGVDASRRDVLARLIHGTRLTFAVGFGAALLLVGIGLAVGVASGYGPRLVDLVLTRLTDAVLALPIFFVALAVMGIVPQPGTGLVIVIIGGSAWPPLSRLVRAETKRIATLDYVRAAEASGARPLYVVTRHIVPQLVPMLGVAFAFGVATATMVESSLSFLGFGVPDSVASWGGLMRGAVQHLLAWWLVVAPGLALISLVIACNVLGEAIRADRSPLLSDRAGP